MVRPEGPQPEAQGAYKVEAGVRFWRGPASPFLSSITIQTSDQSLFNVLFTEHWFELNGYAGHTAASN